MPMQARIDAPGALHHVIARGIERKEIFRDDADREDFLQRLGKLVGRQGGKSALDSSSLGVRNITKN